MHANASKPDGIAISFITIFMSNPGTFTSARNENINSYSTLGI